MNDPYKVLGVSQNATDEEIKAAYRELAKKYHPDNYANNPLADLAAEKMKEINEAYDTISKRKRSGGSDYSSYSGNYSTNTSSGSGRYAGVREMINAGRVEEAQATLDRIPLGQRDAEWHFLMGSVMYRKNWINEAYVNFQNAYGSEPGNSEYREAFERISRQMNNQGFGGAYGRGFGGYNSGTPGGCNSCDLCTGLLCADCLCNGCGGC